MTKRKTKEEADLFVLKVAQGLARLKSGEYSLKPQSREEMVRYQDLATRGLLRQLDGTHAVHLEWATIWTLAFQITPQGTATLRDHCAASGHDGKWLPRREPEKCDICFAEVSR